MTSDSCDHADYMRLSDLILLAATDRQPLPTNAIDQLTPWRAHLVVGVALRAGAELEHGTPETFDAAARAAGKEDAGQTGWWRRALGLEPREPAYVPPPANDYGPPAGWTVRPS
jgi:hypothetical protein